MNTRYSYSLRLKDIILNNIKNASNRIERDAQPSVKYFLMKIYVQKLVAVGKLFTAFGNARVYHPARG